MKHITKSIVAISTLFLFSCSEAQEQNSNTSETETKNIEQTNATIAKDVNVQEFKQLISKNEGTIVDVRTPGEYSNGNIEGARNINIAGDFSNEIQEIDKNKPVYVYCAAGGRSSRAMQMMKEMGFKEVYNLIGGYGAWSRQ